MPHQVESFGNALSVLAGHGQIKHRLIQAFEENLSDIDAESLPANVGKTFADFHARLHAVTPLKGESAVRATVRKMSTGEADHCAKILVRLYADFLRSDIKPVVVPLDKDKAREADALSIPAMLLKSV